MVTKQCLMKAEVAMYIKEKNQKIYIACLIYSRNYMMKQEIINMMTGLKMQLQYLLGGISIAIDCSDGNKMFPKSEQNCSGFSRGVEQICSKIGNIYICVINSLAYGSIYTRRKDRYS